MSSWSMPRWLTDEQFDLYCVFQSLLYTYAFLGRPIPNFLWDPNNSIVVLTIEGTSCFQGVTNGHLHST